MTLEIKYKPLDDLIGYINNSRMHTDEQISQVAASIKEFSFTNPVLIDEENGIIAGHARVQAAKKLNLDEVPTIELIGLSEAQKKAYVIADNKLALNSEWDEALLQIEIEGLKELDFDIDLLGFNEGELDDLLPEIQGLIDEDEVPEPPEDAISKRGDIWLLGNHRVMCGDSTNAEDVETLMEGNKVDMVFTDPPYGIREDGDRTTRKGTVKGGKAIVKGGNFKSFLDDSTSYAIDAFHLCENVPRQVWWGANYYCHSIPLSNNWFIWDKRVEEKQKDDNSDCEMAWVKSEYNSIRIFRHLWKGLMKDSEQSVKRVHPTQKPIALAEWAFEYFKNVISVLDLFGGSGSTLIACEKTSRECYMMELEETYCDVIINRWQNYTGKQAIHEQTQQTYAEVALNG